MFTLLWIHLLTKLPTRWHQIELPIQTKDEFCSQSSPDPNTRISQRRVGYDLHSLYSAPGAAHSPKFSRMGGFRHFLSISLPTGQLSMV